MLSPVSRQTPEEPTAQGFRPEAEVAPFGKWTFNRELTGATRIYRATSNDLRERG